ncbi:ImpA family type VI secretion-associated protein [Escherichia coli]|uniref:ImpA family type VI secretion-associated protein n=1 Tax=Escherichia coli TaxID=562 RepID=A0A2X1IMX5_ECOLX|nr:ImpA family type VI secretion-associated protein [Escherichia coli]
MNCHGEQPQAVPGRQGAGTALENHFAVIPADRTWRPQPLLKPLVDGPQSAVVTGPAGEEIFLRRTWSRAGEVQLGPL